MPPWGHVCRRSSLPGVLPASPKPILKDRVGSSSEPRPLHKFLAFIFKDKEIKVLFLCSFIPFPNIPKGESLFRTFQPEPCFLPHRKQKGRQKASRGPSAGPVWRAITGTPAGCFCLSPSLLSLFQVPGSMSAAFRPGEATGSGRVRRGQKASKKAGESQALGSTGDCL